jgi:RNA polymerase sigma factor (sigma-70 family)
MLSGPELGSERAWVFRVATNAAINASKAHQRELRRDTAAHAEQQRLVLRPNLERTAVLRDIVRRALARVPDPMRQCLLLYHEGLTGREIAGVLGIAPSYVGTLVVRAHDRFRRECEALGDCHDLLG